MFRPHHQRTIGLLAVAGYLLALVVSNLTHVHLHALGDAGRVHVCSTAHGKAEHDDHHHDHDRCAAHDVTLTEASSHEHGELPAGDDDCNICRFLGRPILLVKPFELAEVSAPVTALLAMQAPAVQPIVVIDTHARAPPVAAPQI